VYTIGFIYIGKIVEATWETGCVELNLEDLFSLILTMKNFRKNRQTKPIEHASNLFALHRFLAFHNISPNADILEHAFTVLFGIHAFPVQ